MINNFKHHIDRLKSSGLRSTKQRLAICRVLFDRKETFHFTVEKLKKATEKNTKSKISLATLYNTINAFKKSGYLKEISVKGNKVFYDTNIKNHHHFYDEDTSELLDIKQEDISLSKLPDAPNGKKVRGIEVIIKVASGNHMQKKIN